MAKIKMLLSRHTGAKRALIVDQLTAQGAGLKNTMHPGYTRMRHDTSALIVATGSATAAISSATKLRIRMVGRGYVRFVARTLNYSTI